MNGFDMPICNKFKPSILQGKRCFQLDVSNLTHKKDQNPSLTFVMDYNRERDYGIVELDENEYRKVHSYGLSQHIKRERSTEALIYIETLGKMHTTL